MKKKLVAIIAVIIIIVLIGIIGINLFSGTGSPRIKNNEKHSLSNDEKNAVKDKLSEIDNVDSVKVYKNIKIIKIVVNLTDDADFEQVKNKSNEAIEYFDEENLGFYDVEIYVSSDNKESEVYPKIGYKHKLNKEFTW